MNYFLLLVIAFSTAENRCYNSNITRIFENLSKYQSNSISFHPENSTGPFKGNLVAFKDNIEVLERNSFFSFDSGNVTEINLSNKMLKYIHPEAFLSLKCLSKLDLSKNKLTVIEGETFKGLPALTDLELSGNGLKALNTSSFAILPALRKLNLANNQIDSIKIQGNLSSLQMLNLSGNVLRELDVRAVKLGMPQLKEIDLSCNRWEYATLEAIKKELNQSSILLTSQVVPCGEAVSQQTSTTTEGKIITSTSNPSLNLNVDLLLKNITYLTEDVDRLEDKVGSLQVATIFLSVLVVFLLLVGVVAKTGICSNFVTSWRNRNGGYYDEDTVLLR